MRCARCHGLMVSRPLYLWSCLNCGNCVDETIAFHRAMAKPETVAQRNERIWRRVQHELKVMEVAG